MQGDREFYNFHVGSLFRGSSEPYISGDTFRTYANHVFDELKENLDPKDVKEKGLVFVNGIHLEIFFSLFHPLIQFPYFLMTHNSDHAHPGKFFLFLSDPKLLGWFTCNPEIKHPKIHPIPVGISNQKWANGQFQWINEKRKKRVDRDILLYSNFNMKTSLSHRKEALEAVKSFCTLGKPKPFAQYLDDLLRAQFVLSPKGMGLGCHRTWEALYLGAIPIVQTSLLDPIFQNLPVLIIDDWKDLSKDLLEEKYLQMKSQKYHTKKLWFSYWLCYINTIRVLKKCSKKSTILIT